MADVYRAATLVKTASLSGIWQPHPESPILNGDQVIVKRDPSTSAIHHSQSMLIYARDIRIYIPSGSIQNIYTIPLDTDSLEYS